MNAVQKHALLTVGAYLGAGVAGAVATRAIESRVEEPGTNGIVDKIGLGAGLGAIGLTFIGPAIGFNMTGSIGKSAIVGGLLGSYVGASLLGKD